MKNKSLAIRHFKNAFTRAGAAALATATAAGAVSLYGVLFYSTAEPFADGVTSVNQTTKRDLAIYYTNWSPGAAQRQDQGPADLPWDRLTTINHAFWKIEPTYNADGNITYPIVSTDAKNDNDICFPQYAAQKEVYTDVDLVLSVGGWSESRPFSEMAQTAFGRKSFVDSCVDFLQKHPYFTGIDLDWEYPGIPRNDGGTTTSIDDAENYTLLLQELRAAFEKNFTEHKRITVCAPANTGNIVDSSNGDVYQELSIISDIVDRINLMSYDHAGWEANTGHLSNLYPSDATKSDFSVDQSVQFYLAQGVDSAKLNIGSPTYSRGWSEVEEGPNGDGLGQPAQNKTGAIGNLEPGGVNAWYKLKEFELTEGFISGYDDQAEAAYLYNNDPDSKYYKMFYTYENERSLQAKLDYINDLELGGLIVWDSVGDAGNYLGGDFPIFSQMAKGLGIWDGEIPVWSPSKNSFIPTVPFTETGWGIYYPVNTYVTYNGKIWKLVSGESDYQAVIENGNAVSEQIPDASWLYTPFLDDGNRNPGGAWGYWEEIGAYKPAPVEFIETGWDIYYPVGTQVYSNGKVWTLVSGESTYDEVVANGNDVSEKNADDDWKYSPFLDDGFRNPDGDWGYWELEGNYVPEPIKFENLGWGVYYPVGTQVYNQGKVWTLTLGECDYDTVIANGNDVSEKNPDNTWKYTPFLDDGFRNPGGEWNYWTENFVYDKELAAAYEKAVDIESGANGEDTIFDIDFSKTVYEFDLAVKDGVDLQEGQAVIKDGKLYIVLNAKNAADMDGLDIAAADYATVSKFVDTGWSVYYPTTYTFVTYKNQLWQLTAAELDYDMLQGEIEKGSTATQIIDGEGYTPFLKDGMRSPEGGWGYWTPIANAVYTKATGGLNDSFKSGSFADAIKDTLGLDVDDGIITEELIENIKGLNLARYGLTDVSDLDKFPNLTYLNLNENSIEDIDLSVLPNLEYFSIWDNLLSDIDVSANTKLTNLVIAHNFIDTLDLSKNTELEKLYACHNTSLEKLDLSKNTKLTSLFVAGDEISKLDITNAPNLTRLDVRNTKLTSLKTSAQGGKASFIKLYTSSDLPETDPVIIPPVVTTSPNAVTGITTADTTTNDSAGNDVQTTGANNDAQSDNNNTDSENSDGTNNPNTGVALPLTMISAALGGVIITRKKR